MYSTRPSQAREVAGTGLLNVGASTSAEAEQDRRWSPTEDDRQCWVCLSGGEGLIAPCECSGSMKWVHRNCLDRWRVDSTNPRNFTHCRHCGFAFQLVLQRPPTEDEQQLNERRRRFMRTTISHFILSGILVQAGIMLLAMIIRAMDQKERLVEFFGLPQVEHTPPAGEGDYWNAIRHHKSTYYLAAVLLGLFIVGVIGTLTWCSSVCCSGSRDCAGCDPCISADPFAAYYCGECCSDCCYFCGRCCEGTECPECRCPSSSLGDCDCLGDSSCDCKECGAVLAVLLIIAVAALIFVGFIIVMISITAWIQKVAARYFQLKELRQLTGEYVVQDLSLLPAPRDVESGPAQMDMPEPSAPPANMVSSFAPVTSQTVQMSLSQDLQAVYGYRV